MEKKILEGITSRLDDSEDWFSNMEDRVIEVNYLETKRKKRFF